MAADSQERAGRSALRRWANPALWAVAIAGLGAAVFCFTRPAERTVPSVIGQDLPTASRTIGHAGLRVRVRRVASSTAPGIVLAQAPPAGAQRGDGSRVELTVARELGAVAVPSVAGLPAEQARSQLQQAGFEVAEGRQASATTAAGRAIATSPQPPARLARGSRVTLLVSSGAPTARIPELVGQRSSSVEARMLALGLKVVVVEQGSTKPPGEVVAQSPRAGSRVRQGATVRIFAAAVQPLVALPDLVGTDLEGAVTALSTLGLAIEFRDVARRDVADRAIVEEAPKGGTRLPKGGTVTLTVNRRR